MADDDEEGSGLRARLSGLLGLQTARIYRPVTGADEPDAPPPGRAGASPDDEPAAEGTPVGEPEKDQPGAAP